MHDLAGQHPEKLRELVNLWFHEAGRYHGLPLEDRTAVEILADPTRPQVAPPRDQYVYYPDTAEVPETAAANIRNRSYSIAVEVDVEVVYPADDPPEPCLEPATIRRLDEIARRAEQGDIAYLRTVGRVFEAVGPDPHAR